MSTMHTKGPWGEVFTTDKFSVRLLFPDNRSPVPIDVYADALEFLFDRTGVRCHLFVTVVDAVVIDDATGGGVGLGLYYEGLRTVSIAGGNPEVGISRECWIAELFSTLAHEFLHFVYELERKPWAYSTEDEIEAQATAFAAAFIENLKRDGGYDAID